MPCKHVEVGVAVQNWQVGPNGQRADEAVDESANGCSPASTPLIERRRLIEVAWLHRHQCGPRDEPSEIPPVLLVTRSSQQFHANHIACREVGID